jgi:hypothetical protein
MPEKVKLIRKSEPPIDQRLFKIYQSLLSLFTLLMDVLVCMDEMDVGMYDDR